jgi:hypothetical protein
VRAWPPAGVHRQKRSHFQLLLKTRCLIHDSATRIPSNSTRPGRGHRAFGILEAKISRVRGARQRRPPPTVGGSAGKSLVIQFQRFRVLPTASEGVGQGAGLTGPVTLAESRCFLSTEVPKELCAPLTLPKITPGTLPSLP